MNFRWYLKERISRPSIFAGILIPAADSERAAASICSTKSCLFSPLGMPGPFHHKRNVSTFIVQKLFSTGMAYPMVGKKYDYSVLKNTFFFESFHNLTDMSVRNANRYEVSSPVSRKN